MAYAGFSKGGGGGGSFENNEKFENNENQRKISSFRISPFFCPKLGEDQQKKRSLLRFSVVFGPKLCEDQKKRSSVRFCPFLCSDFLPKLQRGHAAILLAILCQLYYTGDPKGGGHGTMPRLNTPLGMAI